MIGADCTLDSNTSRGKLETSMETERRQTLELLVELAADDDSGGCWDDSRARNLLRSQSSPEELREIGAEETLIQRLWRKDSEPVR